MVPEGVDELILVHLRASLDTYLPGALLEILLRPVLITARLPAALACLRATGVGYPRRFLLALPLLTQPIVPFVILYRWPVVFGHVVPSLSGPLSLLEGARALLLRPFAWLSKKISRVLPVTFSLVLPHNVHYHSFPTSKRATSAGEPS